VSPISASDDLGDSAAAQTRVQYANAPEYTIPPSGWPGAPHRWMPVQALTTLAPRITAGLAATFGAFWIVVLLVLRIRRRRVKPSL